MTIEIHKSQDRGHVKLDWLESYHSFSFGDYYNPKKMGFGKLRVINDDFIAPSSGFGKHPHKNMEIITIMLFGTLSHEDSMGNAASIKAGEVQVMSAGSGVFHSEFNKDEKIPTNLLQIWVQTNSPGVTPRYDQKLIKSLAKPNELYQILSPNEDDAGVWIYQDAWFYLGEFDEKKKVSYNLKKSKNGVYLFVIEGEVEIDGNILKNRDAAAISNQESNEFVVKSGSKILLMEVPL